VKTVAILQPAYLPWLGFFERFALADEVILLDHVRIDRNSKTKFANRNRLRTPQGWAWLTVPLLTKGRDDDLALDALEIDPDGRWRAKHWASIEQNYRRAPCFAAYSEELRATFSREWSHLVPLCTHAMDGLLRALDIRTPWIASSSLESRSTKSELILDLCRERAADRYLSGPFGRDYLDLAAFARAGIAVEFHDYAHPTYRQAYPGFQANLFAYDLLFQAGPDAGALLRTSGRSVAA
jgi:hypothetical protein